MILDAGSVSQGGEISADVCIVGAGAAGITIARDLIGSGLDVLVLEGGDLEQSAESDDVYEGSSTGRGYGVAGCRLRYFGGSTNHWAGYCRPFEASDLVEWPIDLDDLTPWYYIAQETCQLGGFEYSAEAVAQGLGVEALELPEDLARTVVYQYSPPTRFGDVYRSELEQSENVIVYLNCNVVDVLTEGAPEGVSALRCSSFDGVTFVAKADRFVLALGGIENTRILLAGSGGIANSSGLVGVGFAEHPHISQGAIALVDGAADLSFYLQRHSLVTYDEATPLGRVANLNAALAVGDMIRQDESLPALSCSLNLVDPAEIVGLNTEPGADDVAEAYGLGRDVQAVKLFVRSAQNLNKDSKITLSEELDQFGVPRVELHWSVGDDVSEGIGRSMQVLGAAFGSSSLGRLWSPLPQGNIDTLEVHGGCHHMCTTRMSSTADGGVVDLNCAAHDLPNLFIAGSSVFASTSFANPTLTIVALAHRLADHLAQAQ